MERNSPTTEILNGRENFLRDLTVYRLDIAKHRIEVSKSLLDDGHYQDSINRSYYAIFTAVRALLAEEKIDFKKHSAVISYFRKNYIKTGIFDVKFSDYIGKAFEWRNDCDYEDFFFVSREETETQYNHAIEFYEAVKNYLENLENEK